MSAAHIISLATIPIIEAFDETNRSQILGLVTHHRPYQAGQTASWLRPLVNHQTHAHRYRVAPHNF